MTLWSCQSLFLSATIVPFRTLHKHPTPRDFRKCSRHKSMNRFLGKGKHEEVVKWRQKFCNSLFVLIDFSHIETIIFILLKAFLSELNDETHSLNKLNNGEVQETSLAVLHFDQLALISSSDLRIQRRAPTITTNRTSNQRFWSFSSFVLSLNLGSLRKRNGVAKQTSFFNFPPADSRNYFREHSNSFIL